MPRLIRWKSGLALVLLLHLLVHPVVHDQRLPELLASTTSQHTLISEDTSGPLDVCSLCRIASTLHAPAPVPVAGQPLLSLGEQVAFAPQAPRHAECSQNTSRAPPINA